jgi:hypothetical protein
MLSSLDNFRLSKHHVPDATKFARLGSQNRQYAVMETFQKLNFPQ